MHDWIPASVFFIALILCCTGCNHELTESRAEQVITRSFDFPLERTEMFEYGDLRYGRSFGGSKKLEQKHLLEQGLITFDPKGQQQEGEHVYDLYTLLFTSKARKYQTEEKQIEGRAFYLMKAADVHFGSVLRIDEYPGGSLAQVVFSWNYADITPFGIAANLRMREAMELCDLPVIEDEYQEDRVFQDSVMLVRGSRGWKVKGDLVMRGGLIRVE